ncbi:putative sulfate exporter family transporter [Phenylobacterium sp.]|uniref:putative sulfate exporter family transporter n=1 Tax=Phenylobacterium sp. TaxID=1871053 RepID=UPI0025ED4788|nr:putative sulfate exporter family transporter [Phenylobacterium sp.]
MLKAFTQHPETVGETYFEHLGSAWGFAFTMAVGALACLLHGLFPFAFQSSGSRRIRELHERMVTHRTAPKAPARLPAWAPGLALALVLTGVATWIATAMHAPVAPFALVAGFLIAAPLAGRLDLAPGLKVAERPLLRAGIALLGLRIVLGDIAHLGVTTLLLVLGCVALTLGVGSAIGRLFGLPRGFSMLSASATAICGASAAMAVASVLPKGPEAERQTGYVVAVVATLSTLAMLAYPAIAHLAGLPPEAAAIFLGASIHDVAQVAGAGYSVSPAVGDMAVTVKLVRVSLLALVVAAVAFSFASSARGEGKSLGRAALLPGFVIAFFALAGLRSTGVVPAGVLPAATFASNLLIGAGVVAVGAKTSIAGLKSMGWRPLAALACQTALLCGLAFGAAQLTIPPL